MIIDATGHGWMYSTSLRRWVMVRCSCLETSPRGPEPAFKERGQVKDRSSNENYQDMLRFDKALLAAIVERKLA